MLSKTGIEIDHEQVIFSESSLSQIYFELASIAKKQSSYFGGLLYLNKMGDVIGFVSRIIQHKFSHTNVLILFLDNGKIT